MGTIIQRLRIVSYYLKLSSSTALQTTLLGGRNENNIRLNKEQARASKAPYLADSVHGSQLSLMTSLMGVFCVPKPLPNRGLWMPKLVLYGIRLLAKQFLGTSTSRWTSLDRKLFLTTEKQELDS